MDKNCYIRLALLGVENQLAIDMDMPLRVIGYDGSSYRDEMNHDEIVIDERTGKKHKIRHKRYPVVTIVLYFGKTPWKKPLSLYDVLKISDDLKPFVNDYKINLIDVPRLTGEQVEKFTSDFPWQRHVVKRVDRLLAKRGEKPLVRQWVKQGARLLVP
mgnify:CR=1 FL=1